LCIHGDALLHILSRRALLLFNRNESFAQIFVLGDLSLELVYARLQR